MSTDIVTSKVS